MVASCQPQGQVRLRCQAMALSRSGSVCEQRRSYREVQALKSRRALLMAFQSSKECLRNTEGLNRTASQSQQSEQSEILMLWE